MATPYRITGHPYKQCVCLCSKNKEMCGRIFKSLNIVNLYRGMSKLKLKINVKVSQLPRIVVSVALNGKFERFGGFCVDCCYKKETRVERSFFTGPARSRFSPRNQNRPKLKGRGFLSWHSIEDPFKIQELTAK